MGKYAIIIYLLYTLTLKSTTANFFLGSGGLFPLFLSSIQTALPLEINKSNNIQSMDSSIYFQNNQKDYNVGTPTAVQHTEHKDTKITQTARYPITSEYNQGNYGTIGPTQMTHYIENEGYSQTGNIHTYDQHNNYGGNTAFQYAQNIPVQNPQLGQSYNTDYNYGSTMNQNNPGQHIGTPQYSQQGVPVFTQNKGSKGQIQNQRISQTEQISNHNLNPQSEVINNPYKIQENQQTLIPQVSQNYPVQNIPMPQNLGVQYPGMIQNQPVNNYNQKLPNGQSILTQSRFGDQVSTGGPLQPLSNVSKGPNSLQGNTASNSEIPDKQASESSSTSMTGFGLEIMKIIDKSMAGNVVISPYSIASSLALLHQGASGLAQTEITRALRMSPQVSRELFHQFDDAMKRRRSRNTLKVANAIFVSDTITIEPQYTTYASKYFGSNFISTNFEFGQQAANKINGWVSTNTQGLIPYLVTPDSFSEETQLLITNAIFFKGLWNETFNSQRTVNKQFHLSDGSIKTTSFMHNFGNFQSGRESNLDADFLVLPFEGLQYSLIVIVPSEKSSITSTLLRIQPEHLGNILRSPHRETIIALPKFKIRIDTDLSPHLINMGINNIFTTNSQLTALATPGGARPRVTGAIHTAVLSIDEKGGSAAAATLLAVSTLSLDSYEQEFRFNADRPFIAMLWDNELSLPLFLAKISDPTLVN